MSSGVQYPHLLRRSRGAVKLLTFTLFLVLAGCNSTNIADQVDRNDLLNRSSKFTETVKLESDMVSVGAYASKDIQKQSGTFYNTLVAEMYLQQKNSLQATKHYLKAAETSDDKSLLETSVVLAARAGQTHQALNIAKRWVKTAPKSLKAKQYVALLLLRNDQFDESSEALNNIRVFIKNDSKTKDSDDAHSYNKLGVAHQFITQMLKMETHSLQAFNTYRAYLNKYGVKHNLISATISDNTNVSKSLKSHNQESKLFDIHNFQQMSLASLAMKAKKYKLVPHLLENIHSEDSALIKSKALHQLGRNSESATLLRPYVKKKKTKDSLRFEFIRFLILSDQKDEATQLLKKLVIKYPDNKDLLKSLVALNLDQKRWDEAEIYAKQLMFFKDYKSDAHHFMGEIHQARGQKKEALESYIQVVDGKLINSAQSRIPELLENQQGISVARLWLHQQRSKLTKEPSKHKSQSTKNSRNIKQKASLYKIEADLLFLEETYDTAMQYYQRAMVLDPENSDIRYSRGLVYEQQGLIGLAEKDFKHILSIDRHDSSALNSLGYMLAVHTERLDEAHELINKAYRINPKNTAIIDSLGWVHFKRGEMKRAEHFLRKAFKVNKEPEIARHLIEVLKKQGQRQEAKIILMQMLRLHPNNKILKMMATGLSDS